MVYEEENNKGKFCLHCHKNFIPKFNEDVITFLFNNFRNPVFIIQEN